MPNIEIHGNMHPAKVRDRIKDLFEDAAYIKDVIVEVYATFPSSLNAQRRMSYLRVACSPDGDMEDVLKRLEPLNMDIEVLALKQFIPAK